MKTIKRKIRLCLDAYPIRVVPIEEPVVLVRQIRKESWMSDIPLLMQEVLPDTLRSIMEVEVCVPVLEDETGFPLEMNLSKATKRLIRKTNQAHKRTGKGKLVFKERK